MPSRGIPDFAPVGSKGTSSSCSSTAQTRAKFWTAAAGQDKTSIAANDPQSDASDSFVPAPSFDGRRFGMVFKSGSKGLGYYPAHSKAETDAPSVSTFDIDDDDPLSETYALLKQQCGEKDRTYNRIDQWVLVAEHIDIYRSDSSNPSITQGTE